MIHEKIKDDPKTEYYQKSLEWQEELYDNAIRQRNLGWKIATGFFIITLLLAIALVLLVPLKTTVPYTIEVNTISGETKVAQPLKKGSLTQSEVLTKYWIVKYVMARVTYDRQDLQKNYVTVQYLSDKRVFTDYDRWFDPKKPTSPFQIYGETTTVSVQVKSVSFLDKDTASIRINKIEKTVDKETITPWVITMSFAYSLEAKTENDRYNNPFGFQTTKWREDAEIASGEAK